MDSFPSITLRPAASTKLLPKQGSSGPDVKDLQQKLRGLGFDPNGVDGNFGPATEAAVIAFQQSKGLQADGIAGPATMGALQTASNGATSTEDDSSSTEATTAAPGLNLAALAGQVPGAVIAQTPQTAREFGITTNFEIGSLSARSNRAALTPLLNLNYSAQRLLQVFPKYFRNVDVNAYARNPQKIGSRVYANQMGNGDEASGDGFTFRGRGYIQLTGKNNYTSFSLFVGEDCVANPDLVAISIRWRRPHSSLTRITFGRSAIEAQMMPS